MKAVILAGGKGTRLAPYTTIFPKPMVPIGDRPILEIIVRQLAQHGFDEAILSVGHLGELIEAYFQNGHRDLGGLRLSYCRESRPLGTAGPLSRIPGLDETFLVMNGDVLTTLDYSALLEYHRDSGAALTIAMHRKEVQIDLGVLETDGSDALVAYKEKPLYRFDVSMGVYVYEPQVLGYIDKTEYLDFPDLVIRLLDRGERVLGYRTQAFWFDIGCREDYEHALEQFQAESSAFQFA
jgi:NDP-sugar pyrophosphorylase family protein